MRRRFGLHIGLHWPPARPEATDWWEGRAGRTPLHGGDRHCSAHHRMPTSPPSSGSARAAIRALVIAPEQPPTACNFVAAVERPVPLRPKPSTESAADPVADSEHFTVQARRPGPHRPTCGGPPCWAVLRRGTHRHRRLRLRRRRRRRWRGYAPRLRPAPAGGIVEL